MVGITSQMFVIVCWMVIVTTKALQCDVCECLPEQKTVRCANRGLRFLPELSTLDARVYDYVDLRQNLLTFVDFSGPVKFRMINLLENPVSCEHGLINTAQIKHTNEILINCELPKVKMSTTTTTTQIPVTVQQIKITTPENFDLEKDTVKGIGGLFGEAQAYTNGKLEVAWGLSPTMTVFGIVGGLFSCITMCKILQKLKLIDRRMVYAADFEAPAPQTNRIELFEDISNSVRNVFTINKNSRITPKDNKGKKEHSQAETNCDFNSEDGIQEEPHQEYIQVPKKPRNMYFECYGGETSDEETADPVILRPARLRPSMFMNTEALATDLENISFHDNDDYRESIPFDTDSEDDN